MANSAMRMWEYCLLTCTPMAGLDEDGVRLSYHLATPHEVRQGQVDSGDASPLAAITRLLNDLGRQGWELVTWDAATNRGVFKREID